MSEQVGAKIKEARLAAGLTQKALAESIEGLSASSLSKAERGLKELTEEQLVAIAEATGADPELFGVAKVEAPAAPAVEEAEAPVAPAVEEVEAPVAPVTEDKDILKLLKSVDPAVKAAILAALMREGSKADSPVAFVMGMLSSMAGDGGKSPEPAKVESDKGDENPIGTVLGILGGMMGGK